MPDQLPSGQPSPIPDPITQTIPEEQAPTPPALNLSQGLGGSVPASQPAPQQPSVFSKLFNKISSGTDTNYTIDPNSGKTVAVQTPQKPGTLFRNILAAGLLGGGGIGPQEGEHSFAQGLLAGVSGGAKTFDARQQQQDALRREQAQQQYANQLKARQENREDQELNQKEQLNKASIAAYTANTMMTNFNIMKAHQENQLSGVNTLVNKDAPVKSMFDAAGMTPVKEGLNAEEYQKLLADNANDISAHKYIPVITGYDAKPQADGTIHYDPIGALYEPLKKITPEFLSELKKAGIKETDPMYKEYAGYAKDNTSVDPRKFLATLGEVNRNFNYAKNNADIAEKTAATAADYARANAEKIDSKMKGLQIQDLESNQLGKQIFYGLGNDVGFTRKNPQTGKPETVKIPATQDGGYNFSVLTPEEKVGVGNYLEHVQEIAQGDFDKNLSALKADPENKDAQGNIKSLANTLSTFNNIKGSLTGIKTPTNFLPKNANPIQHVATKYAATLTPSANKVFETAVNSGMSLSDALSNLKNAQTVSPEDKDALVDAFQGFYKEVGPIVEQNRQKNQQSTEKINQAQSQEFQRTMTPSGPIIPTY